MTAPVGARGKGRTPAAAAGRRVGPVVGMVEHFSRRVILGWVAVPSDTPPVRVNLVLDKMRVASTFATPNGAMSSIDSDVRTGVATAQDATPPVNAWLGRHLPGPRDDRRLSTMEIRTFSFRLGGVWPYVNRRTRISVRVRRHPLPIVGHGTHLRPHRNGDRTLADLQDEFAHGYLLSQYGRVQLSKQLDVDWQRTVIGLYDQTRAILAKEHDLDVWIAYGTLLGLVREGGYIGHDIDFDAGYLSRHRDGPDAARELVEIAGTLISHGLVVEPHATSLHITSVEDPETRIDLFHFYFDESGRFAAPWGVAGSTPLEHADWQGIEEASFSGGTVLVPARPERLVEHVYGSDWRQPKPGFNWDLDRTAMAPEGHLSSSQRESLYWTNFYAHHSYTEGSSFSGAVLGRGDIPEHVVDIGCGDGRDACAFGATGRTVTGLDRSPVGVEHAASRAAELGLGDRVRFRVCDVGVPDELGRVIDDAVGAAGAEPVLFYLRFFLHAVPEEVQESLLRVIGERSRPGDLFAAEFRTTLDESSTKVHGHHYRRFQDGPAFGARLEADVGFDLLHEEEGTGLSPYQEEDPVLYRVVGRRRHSTVREPATRDSSS